MVICARVREVGEHYATCLGRYLGSLLGQARENFCSGFWKHGSADERKKEKEDEREARQKRSRDDAHSTTSQKMENGNGRHSSIEEAPFGSRRVT
jgi:hypothetical protein